MDEDDNLSNADISIDDEEAAVVVEQRANDAAMQQDQDDVDEDESSDVDLSSVYVLPPIITAMPSIRLGAGSS